jgi:hypothetical protein
LWFLGDGDQGLAAEPGDHGGAPCLGAGLVIGRIPFRLECGLRAGGDPAENLVAAFARPRRVLIVGVGAGGRESAEAARRPGVSGVSPEWR